MRQITKKLVGHIWNFIRTGLKTNIYIGRNPAGVPENSIVLFPCHFNLFTCGLAGILSFIKSADKDAQLDMKSLVRGIETIEENSFKVCRAKDLSFEDVYLGGRKHLDDLRESVQAMKSEALFSEIFFNKKSREEIDELTKQLNKIC